MGAVGVRFRRRDRVHFYDPMALELELHDRVLVQDEDGEKEGRVVIAPDQVLYSDITEPLRPVLRKLE